MSEPVLVVGGGLAGLCASIEAKGVVKCDTWWFTSQESNMAMENHYV